MQWHTRSNGQATAEEKALFTKFTGWGALEITNGVFPDQYCRYKDQSWQDLGARLKSASLKEYAQTRRSTQYAHYTSEPIIRSVYNALDRLGSNDGQVSLSRGAPIATAGAVPLLVQVMSRKIAPMRSAVRDAWAV
ncbi:hypothetical protein [Pseudomonas gessardii]|uniref:Uncharacterized protein n=1 Tax=Pseudomonas gessardii TaxID=78544 RepID=A0A7Y1QPY1_9PSED|nr:hypothetical protein [Pseudomonas gessardii]NNA99454.1 hypothetical protein [Pseudomonas gessardii]